MKYKSWNYSRCECILRSFVLTGCSFVLTSELIYLQHHKTVSFLTSLLLMALRVLTSTTRWSHSITASAKERREDTGHWQEEGGQRTEERGQIKEDRGRRTEERGQRKDVDMYFLWGWTIPTTSDSTIATTSTVALLLLLLLPLLYFYY